MNEGHKLYFYGLKAQIEVILGVVTMAVGIFILAESNMVLGAIFLVGGFILILKGKADRFDFKVKSGTIIHKGDWF